MQDYFFKHCITGDGPRLLPAFFSCHNSRLVTAYTYPWRKAYARAHVCNGEVPKRRLQSFSRWQVDHNHALIHIKDHSI